MFGQCVSVKNTYMKEEEEWSYQHPDTLSALSMIPLADEMSHKHRISVINI